MDVSNRNNQESGVPIPGIGFVIGFGAFCVIAALVLFWLVSSRTVVVLPEEATVQAKATDGLFYLLVLIGGFVFFLVQGMLLYSVIRFRARPNDTSDGPNMHGNATLEIVWTLIPSVVVFVLAFLSLSIWNSNNSVAENENMVNGQPVPIHVTAQRFAWRFEYHTGVPDVNGNEIILKSSTLHTFVKQSVKLEMNSLDVIHSFWIPAARIKQDVMPGRTTEFRVTFDDAGNGFDWVELVGPADVYPEQNTDGQSLMTVKEGKTAEVKKLAADDANVWVQVELADGKTGWVNSSAVKGNMARYRVNCAELCGGGHGDMFTYVFVHENQESFLSWYNTNVTAQINPTLDPVQRGYDLLSAGAYPCATCHTLSSLGWTGTTGPNQNGLGTRAGERAKNSGTTSGADYIMHSIRHPQDYLAPGAWSVQMPTFPNNPDDARNMSEEDLMGITAYLCTQTASGNPQDNTCGLQFADDGTLADIDEARDYLKGIADQYQQP